MKKQHKNRFQPCLDSCLTCLSHSFPLHSTKREWAFSLLGSTHYQGVFFFNSFVSWVISISFLACVSGGLFGERADERPPATQGAGYLLRDVRETWIRKDRPANSRPALQNRIFLREGGVCTQTRKWLLLCFSLCRADLRFPVFKQGQPWPATQLSCLPGTGWLTDWGVVASPCGFCQCRVLVKSIFQAYYDYLYKFMITWYTFFVMRPLGDPTFCGIFKFLCRNSEFNVSPVSGP